MTDLFDPISQISKALGKHAEKMATDLDESLRTLMLAISISKRKRPT